jgi:hypothetical protein
LHLGGAITFRRFILREAGHNGDDRAATGAGFGSAAPAGILVGMDTSNRLSGAKSKHLFGVLNVEQLQQRRIERHNLAVFIQDRQQPANRVQEPVHQGIVGDGVDVDLKNILDGPFGGREEGFQDNAP